MERETKDLEKQSKIKKKREGELWNEKQKIQRSKVKEREGELWNKKQKIWRSKAQEREIWNKK